MQLGASFALPYIGNNMTMYIIIICYAFMCIGSNTAMFPIICKNIYGPIVGPQLYPYVYIFFSIASLTQWALFQFVTQNYIMLFRVFTGLTLLSLVSLVFFNEKPDWRKYAKKEIQKIKVVEEEKEIEERRVAEIKEKLGKQMNIGKNYDSTVVDTVV